MQFPVMTVTTDGKNLMSEAVQSGDKINFDKIIISSKYIADTASIEDMEALTYEWFTTGATTTISGDVTKVTLQTDDVGKSFINISGEIFPSGTVNFNAYSLAITARIGTGSLKLFGISKTVGTKTILTFGTSGTTKIHVSANISTASVGTDIIAYTFDSNYVTGDDFDMFSQTLRNDIEVAKRSDLAHRHYYNNPLDAIRYSDPMNSFKLRSGLYPEFSLNMKGDSTLGNRLLNFIRLEHERYSLVLGYLQPFRSDEDPQICVSGTFIKADGTVVTIQDRLDNLAPIEASTLYQDAYTPDGTWVMADILVSYDDTTLDTEIILEYDKGDYTKLVASIDPRTGIMNWIKNVRAFKSITSIGYLDVESTTFNGVTSYNFKLYKNATNKQDTSRFAYRWHDREVVSDVPHTFADCEVKGIMLINNEPFLIMKTDEFGMYAVPHDLINIQSAILQSQSAEVSTFVITYSNWVTEVIPRSNYLAFDRDDGGYGSRWVLQSPFKLIPWKTMPNGETYETTEDTVITDHFYKESEDGRAYQIIASETTPTEDYTLLWTQRVDTDIKYVVCNGRLIPHID